MTTLQIVKRFFEPVRSNPTMWIRWTWQYFLFALWPVISIWFLRYITQAIEQWNKDGFIQWIIRFWITTLLYYILRIIFRNRWWVAIFWKWEQDIYRKYIPWFISLDNTHIEKIWTGRMVSIIQQWFSTWITLLSIIFRKWMDLIIGLWLIVYVLYTTQSYLIIYFVIALCIVQYIVYQLNLTILANKRLWNPLRNEYSRSLVRILMSKFEIMQQNKSSIEVKKLDDNREYFYELTKKISSYWMKLPNTQCACI